MFSKTKIQEFIDATTPALTRLSSKWFKPGLKSPEGYYYSCSHCDMECGGTENHDKDCLIQLSKNVLDDWQSIDSNNNYTKNFKNEPRPEEEVLELKNYMKLRSLLDKFYSVNLFSLIPLDYNDPSNKCVCCYCNVFTNKRSRNHQPGCEILELSQALSDFYRT